MNKEDNKRHLELSEKIFNMGQALSEEGESKEDFMISSAGHFMILISGLMYDEADVKLFGELCSMFSAKKMLETQASLGPLSDMSEEELLKLIARLRKENGDDSE